MVSYAPLWETMKSKGITKYQLINRHGINAQTIQALRCNDGISIHTLERLCFILGCTPNDVLLNLSENK